VAIYSRSRTKVFCRTDKDPNSKLKQHNQINDANGHHGDLGDKQIKKYSKLNKVARDITLISAQVFLFAFLTS
jgi:hypothetical protein